MADRLLESPVRNGSASGISSPGLWLAPSAENVAIAAPVDELLPHQLGFNVAELVLITEFQPFVYGRFDRDTGADSLALNEVFQVLFQLLSVGLSFRPRPGVGRPLVLTSF